MTPAEHLHAWLTPARRQLLNGLALDRLAHRGYATFARFMKGDRGRSNKISGLQDYYPCLRLVGYLPPSDVWEPQEPLTADEMSTDLRTWFTPVRRELISRRAVDMLSGMPLGVLNRYLNEEPHITFKIASIEGYYPTLQLLGFVPLGWFYDFSVS